MIADAHRSVRVTLSVHRRVLSDEPVKEGRMGQQQLLYRPVSLPGHEPVLIVTKLA